jgi:fumarate reductase flavoprotein subunit
MYSVFDDDKRKNVEEGHGLDEGHREDAKGKDFSGLEGELQKLAKSGEAKISDSWDEIADWMGAKPEVLKTEIDEYNSYCDKGHDEIFLKDPEYLKPLRQPPYYAMRCYVSVTETMGGIKVNEHMEVLDKQGNAIQGVYAAGVIADGHQGQTYCQDAASSTMGFAVNSGRIAGESAAKFVLGE